MADEVLNLDSNSRQASGGIGASSGDILNLRVNDTTKGLLVSLAGSESGVTEEVVGNVAHDAVDSGNPVKIGGKAADPTSMPSAVAAADRVNAVYDLSGRAVVTQGTQLAGEDLTNNVLKVEGQFSGTICAADTQIKATAGFLHTVTISCGDAAPTAGSLIIYDNTAESGTQVFNCTFTTTPFVPFTLIFDRVMATGIYAGFTTTADVNVEITFR
jgi:hypothetical protein